MTKYVLSSASLFFRDYGKKCSKLEFDFDETNEQLIKVSAALEEKEKSVEELEADISALARRIMLMEEENKKAEQSLADTVIKLALSSKVQMTYDQMIQFYFCFRMQMES